MANYKSFVGADSIYFAPVTQDDAAAYAADVPAYLAPAMMITQTPKSETKTQYADNLPFDVMSSEGETELELEITGLPLNLQATLLGKEYDAVNGRMFDNAGVPPDIALGFRAEKNGGDHRYFWFLKGKFSPPTEEQATKKDTTDPKSTKLKYTAISTVHEFDLGDVTDPVKRVVGDESDTAFVPDTWFDAVQVPVAGAAPAFTVTPSPVDGAIDQAVGVAITLTFSNPLAGGAEYGLGLLRNDTQAAITVTRSVSADRKVVTLGHANLTAATTYLITVNGARDVYGQSLADQVFDFTTAA